GWVRDFFFPWRVAAHWRGSFCVLRGARAGILYPRAVSRVGGGGEPHARSDPKIRGGRLSHPDPVRRGVGAASGRGAAARVREKLRNPGSGASGFADRGRRIVLPGAPRGRLE